MSYELLGDGTPLNFAKLHTAIKVQAGRPKSFINRKVRTQTRVIRQQLCRVRLNDWFGLVRPLFFFGIGRYAAERMLAWRTFPHQEQPPIVRSLVPEVVLKPRVFMFAEQALEKFIRKPHFGGTWRALSYAAPSLSQSQRPSY